MINIIGLGPGEFDYITKMGEKLIYYIIKDRKSVV